MANSATSSGESGRMKDRVPANLRRLRKAKGLTQLELAERAGVENYLLISRWERGENQPRDLDALARALDCDVADLVAPLPPKEAA